MGKKKTTKQNPKKAAKARSNIKKTRAKLSATEKSVQNIIKTTKGLVEEYIDQITAGRPSKYDPAMLPKLLGYMMNGLSKENAVTLLGISYPTFLEWCDPEGEYYNPEFSKVIKIGEQLSELWWMEVGRQNIGNKDFNSTLWMMNMQNRLRWSRKLDFDATVKKVTETINTQNVNINIDGEEYLAQVADILVGCGALKPRAEKIIDSKNQ